MNIPRPSILVVIATIGRSFLRRLASFIIEKLLSIVAFVWLSFFFCAIVAAVVLGLPSILILLSVMMTFIPSVPMVFRGRVLLEVVHNLMLVVIGLVLIEVA